MASPALDPTLHSVKTFLRSQAPRMYWRVFAAGLVAIVITDKILNANGLITILPLVDLLSACLVPVTYIVYCMEKGKDVAMPLTEIMKAFAFGAILGLVLAGILEGVFTADGLPGNIIVAVIEESAKVACVVWFLRDDRFRTEWHGILLGAAAGMGFDALENAGYGLSSFLNGQNYALIHGYTTGQAFFFGVSTMDNEMIGRVITDLPTHGVWTAIVAAAIWRERGTARFRLTPGVWLAFGIAVTLHALWDWEPITLFAGYFWYALLAIPALVVLSFFIQEAQARLHVAPDVPAPPLGPALRAYISHLASRLSGALNQASAGLQQPAPTPGAPPTAAPSPYDAQRYAPSPYDAPHYPPSPYSVEPNIAAPAGPIAYPPAHNAPPQSATPPVAAAQAPVAMYCAVCRDTRPPTTQFCPQCGSRLVPYAN